MAASDIQSFYSSTTIFLTGGTGFLGKVLLEKLLRSCSSLQKIYLLVREKKNVKPEERIEKMFEIPLFDELKKTHPDFKAKVFLLNGDIEKVNLGLDEEGMKILLDEVNCIFHLAANIRFNDKLKKATNMNVRPVRSLLAIASKMEQLKSFVHVSTAFSNCNRTDTIEEKFYEPRLSSEQLLNLVDFYPEEVIDDITESLLGTYLNTYILTKNIAEDMIGKEGRLLPITIVRPSIVISTAREPFPGWIDAYFGPTTMFCLAAIGVQHVTIIDTECNADYVPVDNVCNAIIAAGFEAGTSRRAIDGQEVKIYNYVNEPEAPLTHGAGTSRVQETYLNNFKSVLQVMPMFHFPTTNFKVFAVLNALFHGLPCILVDFFLKLTGKEAKFVKLYSKIATTAETYSRFMLASWKFKNSNTQSMWSKLSPLDQEVFQFSMANHRWEDYYYDYVKGIRIYLMKDPLDTVPIAKKRYKKIVAVFYGTIIAAIVMVCLLMRFFVRLFLYK